MKPTKTFFLSLLWFLFLHAILWCAIFFIALLDDFEFAWLLYVVGAAAPFVYLWGGIKLPKVLRGKSLLAAALLWGIGMFLLVFASDYLSIDPMWPFNLPHRFSAMLWFAPLFDMHQPAFVRNIIQPLAVAATHPLMMSGFALGLLIRRQNTGME